MERFHQRRRWLPDLGLSLSIFVTSTLALVDPPRTAGWTVMWVVALVVGLPGFALIVVDGIRWLRATFRD